MSEVKVKAICHIPAAATALWDTRTGVQPRSQPMPPHADWHWNHAIIHSHSLLYNGLHPRSSCNTWITTHLPTPQSLDNSRAAWTALTIGLSDRCLFVLRYSVTGRFLRVLICTAECALLTHTSLSHARQHPSCSDCVLRHDADRSHPQHVLARHWDRRCCSSFRHSILDRHLLRRACRSRHHQLLDTNFPRCYPSTLHFVLPYTGDWL